LGKLPRIFTDILDRLLLKIQLARRFTTFAGVYRRHPYLVFYFFDLESNYIRQKRR